MGSILYHDDFRRINSQLGELDQQFKKVCSELNNAKSSHDDIELSIISDYGEKVHSYSDILSRLEAFIRMSSQRTAQRINAEYSEPFNNLELTSLSIKMDSYPNEDYAEQLYTKATAQRNYIRQQQSCLERERDQKVKIAFSEYDIIRQNLTQKKESVIQKISAFLRSTQVNDFIKKIAAFCDFFYSSTINHNQTITDMCIGFIDVSISLDSYFDSYLQNTFGSMYYVNTHSLKLPYCWNMNVGGVIYIDYSNNYEKYVFQLIQAYIINMLKIKHSIVDDIVFIDPLRMNESGLGILAPLSREPLCIVKRVPDSNEKIRSTIESLIKSAQNQRDFNRNNCHKLLIFQDFLSYGSSTNMQIRQLCMNAQYYGYTIIVTNNTERTDYYSKDIISQIKKQAVSISLKSPPFTLDVNSKFEIFRVPQELPSWITTIDTAPKNDNLQDNSYERRVGISCHYQCKGNRQISAIPYGIDENGNLLRLNFNNELFATFICGAARSGKTNLLHVIITGIITHYHPDDVELWLVDLNKVGFSRYIKHTPPHLKYLILDESPELIFDLIEKLNSIMRKRQMALSGNWDKTTEIPDGIYMPEMFIIIDEFSVLSQIIQNSSELTNINYKEKFQNLLTLGAKVGMHFIFANQTYTSGISGLSATALKQINQRIAMFCPEYSEIKDTLDIKNASDYDRTMMEQLSIYHTLIKRPMDSYGNHIVQSKVLCIYKGDEEKKLYEFIDSIAHSFIHIGPHDTKQKNGKYSEAPHYNPDIKTIVYTKPPMILDGNSYLPFGRCVNQLKEKMQQTDRHTSLLIVGQPKRLLSMQFVEMINQYSNNLIIISSSNECIVSESIIVSILKSLHLQAIDISVIADENNQMVNDIDYRFSSYYQKYDDFESVCSLIFKIKTDIQKHHRANKVFFLFGLDSYITEMSYTDNNSINSTIISNIDIEPLEEGELSLMELMERGEPISKPDSKDDNASVITEKPQVYDARNDLKFILEQGPKLGYHFISVFSSPEEFKQTRLNIDLFYHKILFSMPRSDASEFVGSANSTIIQHLSEHDFRYVGGKNMTTFRPLLHKGISLDGWSINDKGEVIQKSAFDYLD